MTNELFKLKESIIKEEGVYVAKSFREVRDCDIVLSWSGGLDSTVLAYLLTDLYGNHINISLPYIKLWGVDTNKIEKELEYRQKLFDEQFDKFDKVFTEVGEIKTFSFGGENEGGVQPITWVTQLVHAAGNGARIVLGTLSTDSSLRYTEGLKKTADELARYYNKYVYLETPLINTSKVDIIILGAKYDLLNKSWVCELPIKNDDDEIIHCGKCNSCSAHISGCVSALAHKIPHTLSTKIREHLKLVYNVEVPEFNPVLSYSLESMEHHVINSLNKIAR